MVEIEVPFIVTLKVVEPRGRFEKPRFVKLTIPATAVAVSWRITASGMGL